MNKHRLTYLLQRHLAGTAITAEQQELADFVTTNANTPLFTDVMAELMQHETPLQPANAGPWQKMVQQIIQIDKKPVTSKTPVIKLYRWAAAAIVLLLVSAALYFLNNPISKNSLTVTEKNSPRISVTPVNKNVLILADGSQVFPDEMPNGQIAVQGKTIITKHDKQIIYNAGEANASIAYNVLSTAPGSNYELLLPDGSHVWLNAASSVRFPAAFTGSERSVELSGEAWFDVQHADKIPFTIQSGDITTSVMGTAFDIKAYLGQQSMMVSVQRGKVKVQTGNKILALLEKGRQVRINSDATGTQRNIDTAAVAAWKQGNLYYKDEILADIVADLQRVFNSSIQIQRASLKEVSTTASFNKDIGIQKALEILCRITDAGLSKNNGIYIIE